MIYSPVYHMKMIDHYEERIQNAKTIDEKIFIQEQILYHQTAYQALMN